MAKIGLTKELTLERLCTVFAMDAAERIRNAIQRMPYSERGAPSTSILKPEAKDRGKYADTKGEEIGLECLEAISDGTDYGIALIVDPATDRIHQIGKPGENQIYCYFDAVDGTVSVAGLGGAQYQANTGNWGIGFAFTEPTSKKLENLVVGDFNISVILAGNPRTYESSPDVAITSEGKTQDSKNRRLFTSSQQKLSQSFVFYDAFQAFDRNSAPKGAEKLAVELYKHLINRNEGGAFDIKRDYGSLSALTANMLGWGYGVESQGSAFIVLNENLPNMIPSVPIILGAGGIATDFEGNPLAERKLTAGRCNVIYAANEEIYKQVMALVQKAKSH